MKKIITLISLIFLFSQLKAQQYKYIYYLDDNYRPVSKKDATIIGKAYEQDDYLILNCFQKKNDQLLLTAAVKDSSLNTLHGLYRTYNGKGHVSSEGSYVENEMSGLWKYWDDNFLVTDSVFYDKGIKTAYGKYTYYSLPLTLERITSEGSEDGRKYLTGFNLTFTDSVNNTLSEKEVWITNGIPKTTFEVNFTGDRGLLKQYDKTGIVKEDSVYTRKIKEAEFFGGEKAWRTFLRSNLNPSVPVNNNAPFGKFSVVIRFTVKEDGSLTDLEAENDPGYGMVAEAIRVMQASPKWLPQVMYGKVKAVKRRQPITFMVSR